MDYMDVATAVLGEPRAFDHKATRLQSGHMPHSQRTPDTLDICLYTAKSDWLQYQMKRSKLTTAKTIGQVATEHRRARTIHGNSATSCRVDYSMLCKDWFGNKTTGRERLGNKSTRPFFTGECFVNTTTHRERADARTTRPLPREGRLGDKVTPPRFADAPCKRNDIAPKSNTFKA